MMRSTCARPPGRGPNPPGDIPSRKNAPALALPELTACPGRLTEFPDYVAVSLAPGPDLEFRAREALALAQPGTHTPLDFTDQQTGGQGILATGDAFAIQGCAC